MSSYLGPRGSYRLISPALLRWPAFEELRVWPGYGARLPTDHALVRVVRLCGHLVCARATSRLLSRSLEHRQHRHHHHHHHHHLVSLQAQIRICLLLLSAASAADSIIR